jgi:hypothetical protein
MPAHVKQKTFVVGKARVFSRQITERYVSLTHIRKYLVMHFSANKRFK